MACLGALIVVASLGLDFSFQQLVTYPIEAQADDQAFMPVATSYDQYEASKYPGHNLNPKVGM